ncbi:hypothetical protein BHU72_05875 [Desulfuribacillus stibiiarsenatis]|uniref:CRISPR-associated endonuclease Cas1 n=1 Tax=Desulfuribacillus stibiiarsenatis TaxID=1390249 RepID=A0A1E5L4Z6_9FIRM|nr:CRISPR-associated endonuclease Cas4/Cas1 [Desulfuribacillus stibiiarsenatis]OEH85138.1 hypothetical protein BHU72_05875 [Desulfuribacillus stibiiarsenatis]
MEQTVEIEYLSISSIAEILYCPRNFYYRTVMMADERNNHVLEGKWQEEARDEIKRKVRPTGIQTRKVYLTSDNLGLVGVLDTIEENGQEVYPIEFKKGIAQNQLNDRVQLCLQALLLEENIGTSIDRGYIYYSESNQRISVDFTEELRELALQTVEDARVMIDENIIPEPVNDSRCIGCSLISRCLPEETEALIQKTNGKDNMKKTPRRPSPSMDLGRILYIDTPGAYLKKEQGRIKLKINEETKDIPLSAIDQVVLGQPAAMTGSLLATMCDLGVSCYVLDKGKVKGWLQPTLNKNVILRKAQYAANLNCKHTLQFAKAFVTGKINNSRTTLLRYNRTIKDNDIHNVANELNACLKKLKTCDSVASIMGVEGIAAKYYYSVFNKLLKEDLGFAFVNRNRRPPKDPVNCLLSFAYTLLTKDVIEAIIRVGLDPYLGFFHSDKYGRPALALDIMEEFRPIIADSVVITAINTKMLKPDDFVETIGGCELKDSGRKNFFKAYQTRMNQEATHPLFHYKVTYRRMLELQVRFLAKVLTNEWPEYTPYQVR